MRITHRARSARNLITGVATALAAALLLAACGFHLRGSTGEANLPFATISLGFAPTSPLGTELRRYIRGSGGTKVVADPKTADAVLEVLAETREKVVSSLNNQGQVRAFTLIYRFRFHVKDGKGKELLVPTDIVITRSQTFNETQVLAKEEEEVLLYREMQSDLVQQIMRRLAAIKPG